MAADLHALVKKWRTDASIASAAYKKGGDIYCESQSDAIGICADELEAALRAEAGAVGISDAMVAAAMNAEPFSGHDIRAGDIIGRGVGSDEDAETVVRACLNAALSEPSGWMAIETAPKDGTRILLYVPDYPGDKTWTGLWANGWAVSNGILGHDRLPTHWQPLPPRPSQKD